MKKILPVLILLFAMSACTQKSQRDMMTSASESENPPESTVIEERPTCTSEDCMVAPPK